MKKVPNKVLHKTPQDDRIIAEISRKRRRGAKTSFIYFFVAHNLMAVFSFNVIQSEFVFILYLYLLSVVTKVVNTCRIVALK